MTIIYIWIYKYLKPDYLESDNNRRISTAIKNKIKSSLPLQRKARKFDFMDTTGSENSGLIQLTNLAEKCPLCVNFLPV